MLNSIEFVALNTIMSLLSAFIVYYLLSKKAEKTVEFYKNTLKTEAEAWLNSETGAKALYGIGAMIGQGAKQSIGMGTTGGKFKWQDLVTQIGLKWVENKIPGLGLGTSTPGQNLNIEKQERSKHLGSA